MKIKTSLKYGFTLIEMILVLVIMSSIMVMLLSYLTQKVEETRRDRLVIQIQQIQNAGLSFYVSNGYWPVTAAKDCSATGDLSILQTATAPYLPASFNLNPYGQGFTLACDTTTNNFTVSTTVSTPTEAQIIAGRLPIATVSGSTVSSSVTVPGQNLNNARAVNFGNLYHPGACVVAPVCPTGMEKQIIVVPVSVGGYNDTGQTNVYPISSFTAYAYGDSTTGAPVQGGVGIQDCVNPSTTSPCLCTDPACTTPPCKPVACTGASEIDPNQYYWRVCLNVITSVNDVYQTNTDWGANVSVLAITRCGPPNEPVGNSFSVYQP